MIILDISLSASCKCFQFDKLLLFLSAKELIIKNKNSLPVPKLNRFPNKKLWTPPKRLENTVGKGKIACHEQFFLFPVFSKDLYCKHVKSRDNNDQRWSVFWGKFVINIL